MKKRVTVKSSLVVILIVAFLLCAGVIKLLFVACATNVDGVNLKKFAASRNTKVKTLHASRGTIYDNSGDALALSVNSYKLIAYLSKSRTVNPNDPKHVVDKVMTAKALAPILDMDESQILEYLNKEAYQVEFGSKGKNLTEITKKQIEDLELPGIDFIESTQRYYKMSNFASYIVGYAKTNDDEEIVGELGIEKYYDNVLKGKDGFIEYQSDAYGYQLPNVPAYTEEAKSGDDIYLTIDSNIQLITENALRDAASNYSFDWAIMAVMDSQTGAIVASATSPSFNPNDLNTLESYLNPLVSYTYEPGSTMKTFSWAAAIDEGIYDGEEIYKSGSIEVADVLISDFNKTGWGNINFDTGYAYSSNVAATLLSQRIGKQKLYDYYDRFGFGKKTGIELSGEVEGDIDFVYESEVATASFGQGITVTPIELLQAYSAIANDGIMLKPYLVSKIVDENGNVIKENKRSPIGRVMKSETAKKMQELMYKVNYDGLTKAWQPNSVKMSIKTGTAQIASPSGGYLQGEYDTISSLAGIFPSENPRYIIYTAFKRFIGPQRGISKTVVKAVDEIASYASLTNEEETDIYKENITILKNYKSQKVETVKETLERKGLVGIIIGDGDYVINQYPYAGYSAVKGSKVFIVTNSNNYIMENVINWSIAEVKNYAKLTGISLDYQGYGYVKSQSINPGEYINNNSILKVELDLKKNLSS